MGTRRLYADTTAAVPEQGSGEQPAYRPQRKSLAMWLSAGLPVGAVVGKRQSRPWIVPGELWSPPAKVPAVTGVIDRPRRRPDMAAAA